MLDTKSKDNPKIWGLMAVAVLCVCTVIMIAFYPSFEKAGRKATEDIYEGSEYLSEMLAPLVQGNCVLYNEISRDVDESQMREEMDTSKFRRLEKYMDYCIYSDDGEPLLKSSSAAAGRLDNLTGDTSYAIQVVFTYDDDGGLGNVRVESNYLEKDVQYRIEEELLSAQNKMETDWGSNASWPASIPVDVTAAYGMTMENLEACISVDLAADAYGGAYVYAWWILDSSVFVWVMLFLTAFAAAAGLLYRTVAGPVKSGIFRAPAEMVFAVIIALISALIWPAIMIWKTCAGNLISISGYENIDNVIAYAINFLVWFLIFAAIFWIAACLWDLFKTPANYIKERSLIVKGIRWFWKGEMSFGDKIRHAASIALQKTEQTVKKQYNALLHLDFRDRTNRLVLKIVVLNFAVMFIISSFWLYGSWALAVYSVLLFWFLRRYLNRVKEQYGQILKTTSALADGRLDIPIEGDAGIFMPVQEELIKIQTGFKKAVDREVKSERMKTDLITNVSHDLKTPLTAIITYIDLLKNEKNEEKRREYIEILERKSQRLKVLIEDLFEISKATSRNVTLHFVELDIIGLLKQVELEYDRNIKEAGLNIRWNVPGDKVVLKLDSQKAYRVFENLIVNITKYALPNTRVFIDVEESDKEAVIRMKNVSAAELNFDTDEITDRFVRGDASRNTEGSGLGLAIAKSFTELMHGTLKISTEADLFRVEIRFPKA